MLMVYAGVAVGVIAGLMAIFVPSFKQLRYLIATLTLGIVIPLSLIILFNWKIDLGVGHLSLSVSDLATLRDSIRFGIVSCLAALFGCVGFGLGYALALLLGSLFGKNGRKAV